MKVCLSAALAVAAGFVPAVQGADPANAEAAEFFESKVRPLLVKRCLRCHGEKKQKARLRLDTREGLLEGGESGPVLVPGEPEKSLLIAAVERTGDLEMPPGRKLPDAEIAVLRRWVELGAPWPDSGATRPEGEFAITEEDRNYWAFRPIERPPPPPVENESWPVSPIDRFLLARLEAKGLRPNPEASPRELVRRVYFDLIGLPPPPEVVEAFERDPTPEAYEGIVDRLLSSPQFGERWGRHWLDVVRFAQTNGYERDNEKPYAWRYRDFVIRSFNEDKPYDRFVREQLAGDELEDAGADSVVATGFYRLGVWDDEPDDRLAARYEELDDIIRTAGAAFLGLTLGCARCHDHMYDPISQKDYYSILAFFHNIRSYTNPKFAPDSATYLPLAAPREVAAWRAARDARARELEARIKAGEKELEAELKKVRAEKPPFEWALAVRERGTNPEATFVLRRGNPRDKAGEVKPRFPEVFGGEPPPAPVPRPDLPSTGLRSVFASWVASPENPLTARVMANRIWQHLFGRGIVRTPNDFGRAGLPPTHPELLDWLASEFIAGEWRVKRLIKLILLSRAYRMSSRVLDQRNAAADPANDLFWRQNLRRLEAEAIRDAVLAVSGTLNPAAGGRGFFPRLSPEVIAGQSRPGHRWEISPPQELVRRSVYIFLKRTMRPPLLEAFDFTNTDQPLGVRPVTTVAPQALMLLNDRFFHEQASILARRLLEAAGGDLQKIAETGYRLTLARRPSPREREVAVRFLEEQRAEFLDQGVRLRFKPECPPALAVDYKNRLRPEHLLRGPVEGWEYRFGTWTNAGDGIHWVDVERGPFALLRGVEIAGGRFRGRIRFEGRAARAGILLDAGVEGEAARGVELAFDLREAEISLRVHEGELRTIAEVKAELVAGVDYEVDFFIQDHRLAAKVAGEGLEVELEGEAPGGRERGGRFGVRVYGAPISFGLAEISAPGARVRIEPPESNTPERALRKAVESFALVLFNLNEFVYVD